MKLGTFYGTAHINERIELVGKLTVVQERIDISTNLPRPDPNWSTVDTAGHFHACSDGRWPTLRGRDIPMPCDGSCGGVCGGEGYERTEWSCVLCREVIEPGMAPGPYYETTPGMTDWSAMLSGYGTDEAERLVMGSGFGGPVMLRFEATHPESWTFFGPAVCSGGSVQGGPDGSRSVSVDLCAAGEHGDRAPVKVKALR